MERRIKVAALTEVNTHILEVASESPSGAPEWEFFCECGRPECHEQVTLTIEAFDALRGEDLPVLAPGHRLSQAARARMLREDAAALLALAQHQVRRAKKNLEVDVGLARKTDAVPLDGGNRNRQGR
jgi:hypothetical protein